MRYLFTLLTLSLTLVLFAKEDKYKVADIPKELLKNSDAVIRFYSTDFIVRSDSKASMNVKYAITFLNDKAREFSGIKEYYNDNSSLKILSGKIYDKNGKFIKKIKKKDIVDYSANPGFMLLGDSRVKMFKYNTKDFPYTVEYEFEKKYNGLLSYTHWFPIASLRTSLETASLKLELPKGIIPRYKNNNLNSELKKTEKEDSDIYSWNVSNVLAYENEVYSPNYLDFFPNLILTPTNFSYEGTDGEMTSWKSYGKWVNSLLVGRDVISESTKKTILELVSDAKDEKEKIKRIYKYVQNKTRYVCISLGIGGFQPMTATQVDETGYGDCKALSNYTKSLLNIVGIKALYAEVGAGSNKKIEYKDFVSASQTNHIILCVPTKKDTVWLECTSQNSPFNYLGDFTSDRYALLISSEGGKLVKTHSYTKEDNLKESVSHIEMLTDGSLSCDIKSKYHSLMFEYVKYYLNASEKDKLKSQRDMLSLGDFDLNECTYTLLNEGKNTCAERHLNLFIKKKVSVANDRVFLPLNIVNKSYKYLKRYRHRKFDVIEDESYTITDSTTIKIPDCYEVENSPKEKNIETKFGTYRSHISIDYPNITYVRTMTINKGTFLASEYKAFYKFHRKINKAEGAKLVLLKNEEE